MKTIAQVQTTPSLPSLPLAELRKQLLSSDGLIMSALVLFLCFIAWRENKSGGKKKRLADGRWAATKDIKHARKVAKGQIKGRLKNKVSLWINTPKLKYLEDGTLKPSEDGSTIYIPHAERGISFVGGPGTGKTYSVGDPLVRSAIAQGFPTILFDFKYPAQSRRIAGLAKAMGYEIEVFAPGYPETKVCNPLDFLEHQQDATTARQIAAVLNRNFKLSESKSSDPFFTNAGDQLVEAALMLAKAMPQADILSAYTILNDPDLLNRLKGVNNVDPWIGVAFAQLLSSAKSEKTVASIISTASLVFTRFMKPSLLPCFLGETNLSMELDGKKLLIFGFDRESRDVVTPLVASIFHMLVTKNVTRARNDPLIACIDELPTIYLPNLTNWLNENREDGLCTIIGFQDLAQLERAYGKETAQTIFSGTATKTMFNPQNTQTAQTFSAFLGEEEIQYKNKSINTGGGKRSKTISPQERTRKLFAPAEFLGLPQGKCILINPEYGNKEKSSIPWLKSIKITKRDKKLMELSEAKWPQILKEMLSDSSPISLNKGTIEARQQALNELLPIQAEEVDEDLINNVIF